MKRKQNNTENAKFIGAKSSRVLWGNKNEKSFHHVSCRGWVGIRLTIDKKKMFKFIRKLSELST